MVATLSECGSKYPNQSAQRETSRKCELIDRLLANDLREESFIPSFACVDSLNCKLMDDSNLKRDFMMETWNTIGFGTLMLMELFT
ncbi:hypothetical protein QL285_075430 [Trifolium repens]|nr:hypothetical protein QL285_075430 [Trifolium repens]